jgi:type VI secretion system secreted protein VgrG
VSCTQNTTAPNAIVLGPALAPFALLAGSTITNVGNTLVTFAPGAVTGSTNDDLIGVSPGTAVTGFYPPGTDTDGQNAIYAAGFNTNAAVPLAAQNALTTAYNTAAGKAASFTFPGGQDLSAASAAASTCGPSGNLACPTGTFPAGVWASRSSFAIGTGNLTLDGGGNAASIFIFQMPSTLTTTLNGSTSGNVVLVNGASACNVYWQVGSSATLGGATFFGNVLAFSSITINATSFTGRALAGGPSLGTGAVSIPVIGGSLITNPGGS